MKIKKYEGHTEQEVIQKVKDELGLDALVLNIKKTQPKGFFAFLRKPIVEVTAAYDDKVTKGNSLPRAMVSYTKTADAVKAEEPEKNVEHAKAFEVGVRDVTITEQKERIKSLEKKLGSTEDLLEKVVSQLTIAQHVKWGSDRKYENSMIQLFYDTLIEQGVTPEISERLLETVNSISEEDKIDVNLIVKIVYNTIINILGEPKALEISGENKRDVVFFMGPTGVGKTTTIAKLSSLFVLNNNVRVGLVTADTYRIAAVEQLKIYGEILGIEVGVAYSANDIENYISTMRETEDVILIDTAGRSHKNNENLRELEGILDRAPDSERFLVLSITTKYEDLLNIVSTYSSITDFSFIFTKLDETTCLGAILNICCLTGKKVSYVTYGQNVPDDIEIIQPEKIAKALLGFGGGIF